jgi:hypothetical protein
MSSEAISLRSCLRNLRRMYAVNVSQKAELNALFDLQEDMKEAIAETQAAVLSGKKLKSDDIGQEFKAALAEEDKPGWARKMGLQMAAPGIREKIEKEFLKSLDARLAELTPDQQLKLLTFLAEGKNYRERSGLKDYLFDLVSKDERDFLVNRNEWSNLHWNINKEATLRLAKINTEESWRNLAWVMTEGDGASNAIAAKKAILEKPHTAEKIAGFKKGLEEINATISKLTAKYNRGQEEYDYSLDSKQYSELRQLREMRYVVPKMEEILKKLQSQ